MTVPPSLKPTSRHLQVSLQTADYREACKRLSVEVGQMRLQIEAMRRARHPSPPAKQSVEAKADYWRERILRHGGDPKRGIPDEFFGEWQGELEKTADPAGTGRDTHRDEAGRLVALVSGKVMPVDGELDRFLQERSISTRYASRIRRAVAELKKWMVANYGTDHLARIGRREAGLFVDHLLAGRATDTVNSLTGTLGVYWTWMQQRLGVEHNPWTQQSRRPRAIEAVASKRAFTDDEVVKLLSGKTSRTLHDLMRVAALSGMRIDEIARLTVDLTEDDLMRVRDGKTAASNRDVPVHPDIREIIARRRAGKAGHARLFDELRAPPSRKKELSAKASERFTEYRRGIGVDERVEGQRQSNIDFHSFRRWFATKAEQSGQPIHIASFVLGHAEGRRGMTLGTYSAGPSLDQRRALVEAVKLPKDAPKASPEGPLMNRPELATRTA